MKSAKQYKILKAIRDGEKFSRNNRDLAPLQANGYIECTGVVHCSYINADIKLSGWGEAWLSSEEKRNDIT